MDEFPYICDIEAEPLHHYKPGGYHPVQLGDRLHDGRYTVLHKLGWGGYSTVWAARDERNHKVIAVKIATSDNGHQRRESKVMQAISLTRADRPGFNHVLSMHDYFQIDGPNGRHDCFVLDIVGPSVSDVLESRFQDKRLPAKLAKSIAVQALLGLTFLHQQGITHGDLHIRNLAFATPKLNLLFGDEHVRKPSQNEIGLVNRKDGKPVESGVPPYLVSPVIWQPDTLQPLSMIKIIDFGESFMADDSPDELHTPLVVRAPEVIFKDRLDYRVDLWSMGCVLFELFTGQPPFDSLMISKSSLVSQMLDTTSDSLPERWQQAWQTMSGGEARTEPGHTLQEWLNEVYFDEDEGAELTSADIVKVGELIESMLRLEPASRVAASQVLEDPWFQRGG